MACAIRAAAHPVATIPLLVVVLLSYASIGGSNNRHVSLIKHVVGDVEIRSTRRLVTPSGAIVKTPNGPVLRTGTPGPEWRPVLAWIDFHHAPVSRWGPWAYCYEYGGSFIDIDVADDARITAEEAADVYFATVARTWDTHLYTPERRAEIDAYRAAWLKARFWTNAPTGPRILWWGVAHNITIAIVLCALAINVTNWIPRLRAMHLRHRERNQHRCCRCTYPMHGLKTPVCPECGTTHLRQA